MIKHIQTIPQLMTPNCLSVFDYLVGLALKGLRFSQSYSQMQVGCNRAYHLILRLKTPSHNALQFSRDLIISVLCMCFTTLSSVIQKISLNSVGCLLFLIKAFRTLLQTLLCGFSQLNQLVLLFFRAIDVFFEAFVFNIIFIFQCMLLWSSPSS